MNLRRDDSHPNNPTTPPYTIPIDWITGYLTVHSMSKPSYRVAFALWIIIAAFFTIGAILHNVGMKRPYYFSMWSKWALRRRTWRKKAREQAAREAQRTGKAHKQPTPLPSNSQLLSLVFIFVLSMILCFVGPDYLTPRVQRPPAPAETSPDKFNHAEVEQYVAYYTINKAWWTVAGRTGNIAFALFPLCILFALKAAPFALFALPYTTQFSFDKLSTLHRWVGRLIWFITAIHVLAWSIQLATTTNPVTGRGTYKYAWIYPPFQWGWAAFVPFTVLIVTSFRPFRYNFYESFYALHVFLVPLVLFTAGMHHPSVGWWTWSALVIWVAERTWRATWWFWVNGVFTKRKPNAAPQEKVADPLLSRRSSISTLASKMDPIKEDEGDDYEAPLLRKHSRVPTRVETLMSPPSTYVPPPGYALAELLPGSTVRLTVLTPACRPWAPGQHFILCIPSINRFTSHPFTVGSICDQQSPSPAGRLLIFFIGAKAGWTKTLWDNVVALESRGKTHCDGEEPPVGTHHPNRGVLLRTWVEGPFGSVARTDWIEYSSVLLVAGGTGVSFGLSVLVYLCLCLNGRGSKFLGGQAKPFSRVSRVRFVWVVREYSQISWCATILRRCMALCPDNLQVDIFVTRNPKDDMKGPKPDSKMAQSSSNLPGSLGAAATSMEDVKLESHSGPGSQYMSPDQKGRRPASMMSFDDDRNSLFNPHEGRSAELYGEGGLRGNDSDFEKGYGGVHFPEESTDDLDYTHFNGDRDAVPVPAEDSFSRRLQQEGAMRRRMTRKMTMGHLNLDLDQDTTSPTVVGTPGPYPPLPSPHSDLGHEKQHAKTLPPDGEHHAGRDTRRLSVPGETAQGARDKKMHRVSMSSIRESISGGLSSVREMLNRETEGARGEKVVLQFEDDELEDVLAMTEYAWPGRPKPEVLNKLLKEEVSRAKGPIVVACCGPTQLSASIRKVVAAQLDPVKIKKGDMTGYISCVTEEFDY